MICAVVHTYNEEANIARCLSSLSWVDEIVLIDMGSTDKTLKIAKDYQAKTYAHPYTGFVEPARNFGIAKAKGDWIIIIDADEEIPASLALFLAKETKFCKTDFFRIPRKNLIFNKWIRHTGWWPDYQIRFFRKGAVSWTEKIHGIPLTKGTGIDLDPNEDFSIVHYNYQSIEQYLLRLNRYSAISAKELFLANKKFSYKDLFEKPLKEFINRFFLWQGYKDGIHGLGLSLLQSFSELVVYLKLWELEKYKEQKIVKQEIQNEFLKANKELNYWFTDLLLKDSKNEIARFILKFKRKLRIYG